MGNLFAVLVARVAIVGAALAGLFRLRRVSHKIDPDSPSADEDSGPGKTEVGGSHGSGGGRDE